MSALEREWKACAMNEPSKSQWEFSTAGNSLTYIFSFFHRLLLMKGFKSRTFACDFVLRHDPLFELLTTKCEWIGKLTSIKWAINWMKNSSKVFYIYFNAVEFNENEHK